MLKLFKRKKENEMQNNELSIKKLLHSQNKDTKGLWKMIFNADTEKFTDFYYENIASKNIIFSAQKNGEIIGMLHLNPYQMHLKKAIVPASYIVGISVKEQFRRQGIMKKLLFEAMNYLYGYKEPFAFLMPKDEAHYTPFGFVTAYYQNNATFEYICDESKKEENLNAYCEILQEEDKKNLSKFAEELLSNKYSVFACREEEYYNPLIRQYIAENGNIIKICENGMIIGCFEYSEYDEIEIVDAIWNEKDCDKCIKAIYDFFAEKKKKIRFVGSDFADDKYLKEKYQKPCIMVRIINLDMFVRYIKADENMTLVMKISDDIISENNGIFKLTIDEKIGASFICKTDEEAEADMDMAELGKLLFCGIIPEKVSPNVKEKLEKLEKFDEFFVNEFV